MPLSSGGLKGAGPPPPIDRVHLKTGKKFCTKKHYFCIKISKIFWGWGIVFSPDPTVYPSAPSTITNFWIRHCRWVKGYPRTMGRKRGAPLRMALFYCYWLV